MNSQLKSLAVPVASAVFGGLAVFLALKWNPDLSARLFSSDRGNSFENIAEGQKGIQDSFDQLFEDAFSDNGDPFVRLRKMRELMEKQMEQMDSGSAKSNPFDHWFSGKFGGGSVYDISSREDDDFVYYELKMGDSNFTSLNTKVANGYVTITGTIEQKGEDNQFQSSFTRSFPLPDHVDADNMQMVPEKDKIVLKFPKVK